MKINITTNDLNSLKEILEQVVNDQCDGYCIPAEDLRRQLDENHPTLKLEKCKIYQFLCEKTGQTFEREKLKKGCPFYNNNINIV